MSLFLLNRKICFECSPEPLRNNNFWQKMDMERYLQWKEWKANYKQTALNPGRQSIIKQIISFCFNVE